MIDFLLALALVFIMHELGHVLAIMILNGTENIPFYHLGFEWSFKYFYVIHEKFEAPFKNLVVAVSGSLFPIALSIALLLTFDNQFSNIFTLLSFANLIMLHPNLPDGKNIISSLNEWGKKVDG
ncbi:hypothetical protein [Halobacillus naozhouensis]|uniref:Peptidase family M50 n=1 Tax=Halobacillus naozhouensis TaxID=554880 RepID=A0ABY8IV67_9BACI|nr:hypothetical protein [Halobacillus naozhouensis]WFT74072.1 hypothetical protein P9989_17115 [Halobacillus naozhouensis]